MKLLLERSLQTWPCQNHLGSQHRWEREEGGGPHPTAYKYHAPTYPYFPAKILKRGGDTKNQKSRLSLSQVVPIRRWWKNKGPESSTIPAQITFVKFAISFDELCSKINKIGEVKDNLPIIVMRNAKNQFANNYNICTKRFREHVDAWQSVLAEEKMSLEFWLSHPVDYFLSIAIVRNFFSSFTRLTSKCLRPSTWKFHQILATHGSSSSLNVH